MAGRNAHQPLPASSNQSAVAIGDSHNSNTLQFCQISWAQVNLQSQLVPNGLLSFTLTSSIGYVSHTSPGGVPKWEIYLAFWIFHILSKFWGLVLHEPPRRHPPSWNLLAVWAAQLSSRNGGTPCSHARLDLDWAGGRETYP